MDRTKWRNRQTHHYSLRFQHTLSLIARSNRQKINKDKNQRMTWISTKSQLDLIDIFSILRPTTTEYRFFSISYVIFINTDKF